MGEAVIRDIDRMGGRQVWRWMVDRQGQKTRRLGWKTTDRTKIRAFKNTKSALRDGMLKVNDHETFHELNGVSFAAEPGTRNEGRITTQTDRHDDLAMSLAIGVDVLMGFEREDLVNTPKKADVHEDEEGGAKQRPSRPFGRTKEPTVNSWGIKADSERWGGGTD